MQHYAVRIAGLLILLSLGYNAGAVWSRVQMQNATPAESEPRARVSESPDPSRSPREVVALQVAALQQCLDSETALRQCYELASPANREATGPIDRFAEMLLSPQYSPLVRYRHALVGQAMVQGDVAIVMVSVEDHAGVVRVYRFFLSRQAESPHEGCWMTDGVVASDYRAMSPPAETIDPGV